MKRIITMLVLMVTMSMVSMASDVVMVTLPSDTVRVISSDFSSGGGEKAIIYIEVLIEKSDGTYEMYLDSKTSASGMLGLGRWTMPDKFKFTIDKTGNVKGKINVNW